jgi:hypothetical protein
MQSEGGGQGREEGKSFALAAAAALVISYDKSLVCTTVCQVPLLLLQETRWKRRRRKKRSREMSIKRQRRRDISP